MEENLRDLWDNIKHINMCVMGVQKGEERDRKISQNIIWLKKPPGFDENH